MGELMKLGTKNIFGNAMPLMTDADGILKVADSGRYIPHRNENSIANLEQMRKILKQKYIASQISILTDDSKNEWGMGSSSSGSMSWDDAKDAAKFYTNTTSQAFSRTYSPAADFSSFSHFMVDVEFESISAWSRFEIRFLTDSSNYFSFNLLDDAKAIFGLGEITFDKTSCETYKAGSPSWDNITSVTIRIGKQSGSDAVTAYIKDFYGVVKKPQNAKFLFRIDDGLLSVYQGGMPVFRKYNIPASCFVNPGYVLPDDHGQHTSYGGLLAMSLKELQELHSMGWSICSHTWYHSLYRDPTQSATANYPRYKYSQAYFDLSSVQDWLMDNGFADGALCNVYGNHYYNAETLEAELDLMLLSFSRHQRQTNYDTMPWGKSIRHVTSTSFFERTESDGVVTYPKIDEAIAHGGLTIIMCHRFDDIDDINPNPQSDVANQGSVRPETLDAALAYICEKTNVDCITAKDLVYATPVALR